MSEQERPERDKTEQDASEPTAPGGGAFAYLRRAELSGPTADGRAAVLLDADLNVVWANPAGARLLGAASPTALSDELPASGTTLLRQARSAARKALDGEPAEAVVRTRHDFRTRLLTIEARACDPGVLLTSDGDGTAAGDDLATVALAATSDGEEAALLDPDGTGTNASAGFAALGLSAAGLAAAFGKDEALVEGANGRHRVRLAPLGDRHLALVEREPEPELAPEADVEVAAPLASAALVGAAERTEPSGERRWFYRAKRETLSESAETTLDEAEDEVSQAVHDVRETFEEDGAASDDDVPSDPSMPEREGGDEDADVASLLTQDPEAQDEAELREAVADRIEETEPDGEAAPTSGSDADGIEEDQTDGTGRPVGVLTRAASGIAATAIGAAGLVRTVTHSDDETDRREKDRGENDELEEGATATDEASGSAEVLPFEREQTDMPVDDPDMERPEGSQADEEGRAALLALDGASEDDLEAEADEEADPGETDAPVNADRSVSGFIGAALYSAPPGGFHKVPLPAQASDVAQASDEDGVEDETAEPVADRDFRFQRRDRPSRFVWAVDGEQRFSSVSGTLAEAVGPRFAELEGERWQDVAERLGFDEDGAIGALLARGDTWSGRTVLWPVEGEELRVPVDLAGLPAFDRDRNFTGFNGFGIVRTADAVPDHSRREPEDAPAGEPEVTSDVVDLSGRRTLSQGDRETFERIGEHLGSATETESEPADEEDDTAPLAFEPQEPAELIEEIVEEDEATDDEPGDEATTARRVQVAEVRDVDTSILARLPIPVLAYRGDTLLFANTEFFKLTGYGSLHDLADAGGVDALFGEQRSEDDLEGASVLHREGRKLAVEAHLQTVPWDHERAMLLTLKRSDGGDGDGPDGDRSDGPKDGASGRIGDTPRDRSTARGGGAAARARRLWRTDGATDGMEGASSRHPFAALPTGALHDILDTGSEGVLILDGEGTVRALNRPAEALFGIDAEQIVGEPFLRLLAPESHRTALDYLAGLTGPGVASMLNDGREVIGRVGADLAGAEDRGLLPLTLTIGPVRDGSQDEPLYCAVLRDQTQWKKTEEELVNARSEAERLSRAKTEFLSTVSHEVRNPLTAIIGFSEMMVEERFGPLGSERYLGYARDIRSSGKHVLDIVNDLLDISKIEAGEMRLDFGSVALNTIVTETVAISQPQANRERIVIRTSLSADLPPVVADERSMRQIVLNLVSNALRYTRAGGQVIVSTAGDGGDVVLRVRDTGVGMNAEELERALQPFRQNAQAGTGHEPGERGGTGLGLPLTKAMVEANRAAFAISSTPQEGTLVEMRFPPQRVLTH